MTPRIQPSAFTCILYEVRRSAPPPQIPKCAA